MRIHPKVKEALKRPKDKQMVLDAIEARRLLSFVWGSPEDLKSIRNKKNHLYDAVYSLLKEGVKEVEGQPIDIWMMKFLRDYEKASFVPRRTIKGNPA